MCAAPDEPETAKQKFLDNNITKEIPMRDTLQKYEFYFRSAERYADFDLCLWPGEIWLTTEPQKMTWLEAIEIAGQHSNIRLPHYADIIQSVKSLDEKPELVKKFAPLEKGEFWTIGSEGFNAQTPYACCVLASHKEYDSHQSKFEKKWVRFIKQGAAETAEQIQKKNEEREKNIYEEELHQRTVRILGLNTPEGKANLETHIKLMKMNGF